MSVSNVSMPGGAAPKRCPSALWLLIPLILQVFGIEDRGGEGERLSAADEALLERLLAPEETQLVDSRADAVGPAARTGDIDPPTAGDEMLEQEDDHA